MDIWWAIVEQQIIGGQTPVFRILKCVKATLESKNLDALYAEHYRFLHDVSSPGGYRQAMLFFREPDETPLQEIR
jgi:hypothetical protein